MVSDVATILLGVCVGAIAVLYAARRGYVRRTRGRRSSAAVAPVETTYAPAEVEVAAPAEVEVAAPAEVEVAAPAEVAPAAAELALPPAPALYETVQPVVSPAPVTYAPASVATFGGSTASRKPTRTYRRRTTPVRSTSASKAPHSTKTKKR